MLSPLVNNSYRTGEEGKAAFEEAFPMRTGGALAVEETPKEIEYPS